MKFLIVILLNIFSVFSFGQSISSYSINVGGTLLNSANRGGTIGQTITQSSELGKGIILTNGFRQGDIPRKKEESITAIEETKKAPNLITIYPIPAENSISVEVEFKENKHVIKSIIKIFDFSGREMDIKKIYGKHIEIGIEKLPAGLYYLSITNEKGIVGTQPFIKL